MNSNWPEKKIELSKKDPDTAPEVWSRKIFQGPLPSSPAIACKAKVKKTDGIYCSEAQYTMPHPGGSNRL